MRVGVGPQHPPLQPASSLPGEYGQSTHQQLTDPVTDRFRGHGIGELLMRRLAILARETGGRLEWWVLRSNTHAHRFYGRLGARDVSEIAVWRLADRPLDQFVNLKA